jgi:uncharacterized membrane protein YcaP (DUF421 family)
VPPIDWGEVLGFTVSPLELAFRGTAMYWFLFLAFRLFVRRDMGSLAISDVLVLVLVADAAQNAMASDYRSVTDGFVLVGTILAWNILLDWAAYASPRLRRLLSPPAVLLIRNGTLLRRNLRRELVTEQELQVKLRQHGIEDFAEVKAAFMESDGEVSVLKRSKR